MSIMDFFTKFKIVPFLKKNDTLKLNLISGFFDSQDTLSVVINQNLRVLSNMADNGMWVKEVFGVAKNLDKSLICLLPTVIGVR